PPAVAERAECGHRTELVDLVGPELATGTWRQGLHHGVRRRPGLVHARRAAAEPRREREDDDGQAHGRGLLVRACRRYTPQLRRPVPRRSSHSDNAASTTTNASINP